MDAERVREFFRKYPSAVKIYDQLGGIPATLQIILGLSVMTALVGFFSRYPYVGMACAAVFAYYGISAYLKFKEWWDKDKIDYKLIYQGLPAELFQNPDGTYNVVARYNILNNSDFDIIFLTEAESFSVGDKRYADTTVSASLVIPARNGMSYRASVIKGVSGVEINNERDAQHLLVEICGRYGKDRKHLTRRWFLTVRNSLPPALSGVTHSSPNEWNILRNDVETVLG